MVRLNRIYTRTGDDGSSGLVDGSRRTKHDARFEAIGAVDEANSTLGWAMLALEQGMAADLSRVQNDMFDLGADLATPGDNFTPGDMQLRMVPAQVEWLEQRIDAANADLAPLTSFILPGGSESAARLHLARTSVRRAERAVSALASREPVNPAAQAYINRLSDLLFVIARVANAGRDPLWVPGANR